MSPTSDHVALMRRALALAARGRGRVEPNPMVGCVLARHGRIIAEGYHHRFGGPHAEVEALRSCRAPTRGCDAYVSLEPCSHFGKTPPCTSALIEAGVARVFAAMLDPGEHVNGRGLRQLRRAGVDVETGLLADEARRLNGAYLKLVTQKRPWVILKWAQSIDGKLATHTRREATVSCPQSRRLVHRWRGEVDAVLTGIGTALADDPLLTARLCRPRRVATRIILDSQLRLPPKSRLACSARTAPVLVVCAKQAAAGSRRKAANLTRQGCEVWPAPSRNGRINLASLLDELGRRGMTRVLVEGGGRVLGSFFDQHLADEARIFVSPALVGGREAPAPLDGTGRKEWPVASPREQARIRKVGSDLLYLVPLRSP